jgi:hypothetical protein
MCAGQALERSRFLGFRRRADAKSYAIERDGVPETTAVAAMHNAAHTQQLESI